MSQKSNISKRKSNVWEHYNKESDKYATCLVCNKQLAHSGNTTNMWLHLRRKHPDYYANETLQQTSTIHNASILSATDGSILSAVLSISPNDPQVEVVIPEQSFTTTKIPRKQKESKNQQLGKPKKLDRLLIEMICTDFQPISIVEFKGFRKLLTLLEPRYTIPSRQTIIEKLLPPIFTEVRKKIENVIQNAKYISITVDVWTSSVNDISFLSVTAHFIFGGKLNSFLISTEILTSHDAETIANILQTIFNQWNLDCNKIVCLITDNDNVMEAAACLLGINQIPCVAQSINLVVKDAFKENSSLTAVREICRNIVSYFIFSPSATSKFNEVQQTMKGNVLELKQEDCSHWRSTLIMFSRLLQTRVPLTTVLPFIYQAPSNLTSEQWQIVEDSIALLKPLDMLCTELSKESYPIISRVIPLVEGTQMVINNYNPKTNAGNRLKADLLNGFSKRLCEYEKINVSAIATILDPRLKKFAFSVDENATIAISTLKTEIEDIYKAQNEDLSPIIEVELTTSEEIQDHDESSIWDFFKRKSTSHIETNDTSVSKAIDEIRRYMLMPLNEIKSDPLMFWESEKMIFEVLSVLAQKYLCVPATSVPSERLFSKAGQFSSERRNRLTPTESVNEIVFLNHNLNYVD